MHEMIPQIAAILPKYMRRAKVRIDERTTLRALGVDALDIPMIFLDAEEIYGVQVEYHIPLDDIRTVGCLAACVRWSIEARALQLHTLRTAPRKKSSWVSTSAA